MTRKGLIWFIVVWCILILISYYSFILLGAFIWLLICAATFVLSVIQIVTLIGKNNFTKPRAQTAFVFIILFLLTFFRWTDSFIEKADWYIFFNKRIDIVEQVKQKKLNPTASWNGRLCQLPFKFPIISNSGNDIIIERDSVENFLSVKFFISRGMFDGNSHMFIYSNNPEEIKRMENLSKRNPKKNWKIKDNWYRILDR